MTLTRNIPQPSQFTVTLKPGADAAKIVEAIRKIPGVESVERVR